MTSFKFRNKKKMTFLLLFYVLIATHINAQSNVIHWNKDHIHNDAVIVHQQRFFDAVDTLIRRGNDLNFLWSNFSDSSKNKWGLAELIGRINYSNVLLNGSTITKPTLLGIMDVITGQKYVARLALISRDDSIHSSISAIYNLIADYDSTNNRFVFGSYTDWYTRYWFKTQIGKIQFYKQSKEIFNFKEADSLSKFNDSIAKLFRAPAKSFYYYSCTDPFQFAQLRGFSYFPNEFYARGGGWNTNDNIMYSASNTEYYPHEIVHSYTKILRGDKGSRFADEGIATYLGGSANIPYEQLLKVLKDYVVKNKIKLTDLFKESSYKNINADVSTLYSTGALVAKLILQKHGFDGWETFLGTPEDGLINQVSSLLDVNVNDLNDYLLKELRNY